MLLSVKRLLGLFMMLSLPLGAQAIDGHEGHGHASGETYAMVTPPQPTNDASKIEVVELFWYGCPHCFQLEPKVEQWQESLPEDVDFIRMPAILGPNWELLARAWYAAELLDATDKIHGPLFKALHVDRKRIARLDQLREFFIEQGVSAEDFDNTYNSFGVAAKVNRAKQMTQRYGINGVPAMIVNGKYRTNATLAGNEDAMFEVVNELIQQERQAAK